MPTPSPSGDLRHRATLIRQRILAGENIPREELIQFIKDSEKRLTGETIKEAKQIVSNEDIDFF